MNENADHVVLCSHTATSVYGWRTFVAHCQMPENHRVHGGDEGYLTDVPVGRHPFRPAALISSQEAE